jgi:tetrapyrrole methylase family protein/MazG family protein
VITREGRNQYNEHFIELAFIQIISVMNIPSPNSSSFTPNNKDTGNDVVDIMATLRGPDGCPWDREQTSESLKPYLLEEVYEVLEAIDAQDPSALKEELGDLLLQILFHSQIASEQGHFSYQDVKTELRDKLIRRHPHVFHKQDNDSPPTTGEVLRQWEQLKQQEKGHNQTASSALASVPKTSPALQRALQVQKRASHVGFDWKTIEPVLQKFKEELDELLAATTHASHLDTIQNPQRSKPVHSDVEAEFGDVLFSLVNVSRFLRINPEDALRKSTNKFIKRFQYVESQAIEQGKQLTDFPPEKLEHWWDAAKRQEAASSQMKETKDTPTP